MLARGSLSDEEYLALCRFRAEYEAAAVRGYGSTANWDNLDLYAVEDDGQSGRMRASKQPKTPRSDPARVVDTLGQINAVFVAVGPLGFEFLRAVAVLGLPLVAVAGLLSIHRDIAAFRFREAVETLADHYGDAA